ncbi:MAG TPA: hypothetical protein VEB19_18570 [Gemmatimonadaceae bacterium]|nr:hypothetical protein [Gemmatimonadaceae bacterium]
MQRSKQTALMFLLGAVLVGGVLGFSADRVITSRGKHWAPRMRMYQDLALTEAQQATMDSLLDARNCQIGALMKPMGPQLDSIKKAAHQQVLQILTPAQRLKLEERVSEQQRRDSLARVRRDSLRALGKSTPTCK